MSHVPTIELNDGANIPQLGFGVFQIDPDETAEAVRTGTRHRLPPHRHRRDVPERGRRRAGHPRRGHRPRATCSSPASSTTASTSPTTPAAPSTSTLSELGFDYVDLFLIHWPLPTLYDGDFVSTWQALEEFKARRPRPQHRRVELPGRPPRAAGHRDRHGACGQPDRGAPVLRQRRGARLRAEARHRDRGVVADRAGRGARRPGRRGASPRRRASRRRRSCCAGTSSAATSCSRSR